MFEFRKRYDVFLSFRGEDTRRSDNNFATDLSEALCKKGFRTSLDEGLERGKAILTELHKAIESSGCSIIIVSENYASSSWCLNELVKILECHSTIKHYKVLPIFYRVDPSHVRHQSGAFGKAFKQLCKGNKREQVNSWSAALTEVGNIGGWHLPYGDEAKFIKKFVKEVSKKKYARREMFKKWPYVNDIPLDEILKNAVENFAEDIKKKRAPAASNINSEDGDDSSLNIDHTTIKVSHELVPCFLLFFFYFLFLGIFYSPPQINILYGKLNFNVSYLDIIFLVYLIMVLISRCLLANSWIKIQGVV